MSTTIDSKVVEMRFDNQQFEHGVNQSISSIDRLKSALSFGGIKSGVGTITTSINGFGIIAKRVLENVADVAFNTGTRIVKSLSVDQISEGWRKYEEIIRSTQTIMAATKTNWVQGTDEFKKYADEVDKFNKQEQAELKKLGKNWSRAYTLQDSDLQKQKDKLISLTKDQKAQMEFVNKQMEKLNWYTDETSYNLVDMTSNIGKFTAAGIGLEDATNAMMGIASWAAISGASVQQASRAMYNLSQAMGMGELRLQDWMSIENANMATLEFKNTALQTAASLGKLKKNADGTFTLIDKKGKKTIITAENFRASLAKKWFDKKVITATLKVYGDFANDLYKYTEKTGLTATQLLKYTDQVKKGILDVNNAGKMSDLGKELGLDKDQLSALTEGLKEMSSAAKDLGFNAFRAGQEAKTFSESIQYVKDAVSTGWMNTFKTIFGDYLNAKDLWTEVAEEFYDLFVLDVERQNDVLKKWAEMGGREQILWGIKKLWRSIKAIFSTIRTTFNEVFPPATGELLYKISARFHSAMNNVEKGTKPLTQRIRYIPLPLFTGFKNILESIINVAKAVGNAFKNIFNVSDMNILENATSLFEKLTKYFKITEERGAKLERVFKGIFAVIDIVKTVIQELLRAFLNLDDSTNGFGDGILNATANLGDWLVNLKDWLKKSGKLKDIAQNIAGFLKNIPKQIDKISVSLTGLTFGELLQKIIEEYLPNIATWIGDHLPGIQKDIENTNKVVEKVSDGIGTIIKYGSDLGTMAGSSKELNQTLQSLGQYLRSVGQEIQKKIKLPQSVDEWSELFKKVGKWLKLLVSFAVVLQFWDKIQSWKAPFVNIINGAKGFFGVLDSLKWNIKIKTLMMIINGVKQIALMMAMLAILPTKDLYRAANIVMGVMITLAGIFLILSKIDIDEKQVLAMSSMMKSFSIALALIFPSLAMIAMLAEDNMKGVIAASIIVPAIMAAMAGAFALLAKIRIDQQQLVTTSVLLAAFAAAIIAIGGAFALATMHGTDAATIGVLGHTIATILMSMAVAANLMPRNQEIKNTAIALVGMAAAIAIISAALYLLSGIPNPASLVAAGAALAIVFVAVSAGLGLLNRFGGNQAGTVQTAAALMIASTALIAIALAIAVVAQVVNSGNAVPALLVLAGALGALVLAALLCSNPAVQAALYAIGAACALIGVGALTAGAGLVLFASAVERLAAVGPDGVILLVNAIKQIALVMPEVAVKVAEAIIALLDSFVKSRDKVVEILAGLINILFDVLIQTTPKLFEFLGTLIENICLLLIEKAPIIAQAIITVTLESLRMLREIIPVLTETLFAILLDTLRQIRDNIEEIIQLSVEIGILTLTGFIKGITEQIPNLVETGWGFVLALINGIAEGVDKHAKELQAAIKKLADALINGFCTLLGIRSPSKVFDGFGKNIVQGVINGITEMAKNAWDAITGLATDLIDKFKEGFKDIKDKASEIIGGKDGVVERITGFVGKMKDIGSNLINALKKGMEKAKEKLTTAATTVGDVIIGAIKKVFHIKSPSRVFMEIGRYLDEGLAIGLEDNAYKPVDATENVAKSMTSALSSIVDMVNVDTDLEPVIKPVLDLSDITTGVDQMNSMLSANRSVNLAMSSSGSISSTISAQQQTNAMLDTLRATLSNFGSDGGTVTNNTFNITGDDPKAIANEVSRILQNQVERRDAAWA